MCAECALRRLRAKNLSLTAALDAADLKLSQLSAPLPGRTPGALFAASSLPSLLPRSGQRRGGRVAGGEEGGGRRGGDGECGRAQDMEQLKQELMTLPMGGQPMPVRLSLRRCHLPGEEVSAPDDRSASDGCGSGRCCGGRMMC
eukprot:3784561-Rhodomonas_salina.1